LRWSPLALHLDCPAVSAVEVIIGWPANMSLEPVSRRSLTMLGPVLLVLRLGAPNLGEVYVAPLLVVITAPDNSPSKTVISNIPSDTYLHKSYTKTPTSTPVTFSKRLRTHRNWDRRTSHPSAHRTTRDTLAHLAQRTDRTIVKSVTPSPLSHSPTASVPMWTVRSCL